MSLHIDEPTPALTPSEQLDELVFDSRELPQPDPALTDSEKLDEILSIMRDLEAKVQAGAEAIPSVLEKLYGLPIIGGALRNMFGA